MKSSVRSQRFLGTSCCVVLLLLAAPFSAARSQEKIPREVIDEAAHKGLGEDVAEDMEKEDVEREGR